MHIQRQPSKLSRPPTHKSRRKKKKKKKKEKEKDTQKFKFSKSQRDVKKQDKLSPGYRVRQDHQIYFFFCPVILKGFPTTITTTTTTVGYNNNNNE